MLIAECGNSGQGDMEKCFELIRQAKWAGADVVKFQAYKTEEMFAMGGSMSRGFYEKCWLGVWSYVDLIKFGESLDIPVFFSTNNPVILNRQKFIKVPNQQSLFMHKEDFENYNKVNAIISFSGKQKLFPALEFPRIMYASDYLEQRMDVKAFDRVLQHFKRNIGWSCHAVGIENCLTAIRDLNVKTVEKHFILEEDQNNIYYVGKIYRDCLHSATPKQFKKISEALHD